MADRLDQALGSNFWIIRLNAYLKYPIELTNHTYGIEDIPQNYVLLVLLIEICYTKLDWMLEFGTLQYPLPRYVPCISKKLSLGQLRKGNFFGMHGTYIF